MDLPKCHTSEYNYFSRIVDAVKEAFNKDIENKASMKERSILFNADMVNAILDGRKTQTRRIVKHQDCVEPENDNENIGLWVHDHRQWHPCDFGGTRNPFDMCPYGVKGDRFWVKETFYAWGRWITQYSCHKSRDEHNFIDMTHDFGKEYHFGTQPLPIGAGSKVGWWKRPSIFMPKSASRIQLEITNVKVERLNTISEQDAIAEGIELVEFNCFKNYLSGTKLDERPGCEYLEDPIGSFRSLWKLMNGPESWDKNPWVWVVEFKVATPEDTTI